MLESQDKLPYQTQHKNIQPAEEGDQMRFQSLVFRAENEKKIAIILPEEKAQRFILLQRIHIIFTILPSLPLFDIY